MDEADPIAERLKWRLRDIVARITADGHTPSPDEFDEVMRIVNELRERLRDATRAT